jgi:penicillin V acylase-like amidase (Ntn superfamily)
MIKKMPGKTIGILLSLILLILSHDPAAGMNDQGLVISGSLTPRINIKEIVGKKTVGSALEAIRLNDLIYRRCATVCEFIEKIKKINFKFLETGHFLVTDRTGASVILEGDGKGNLVLIYRDRQVKIVPDRQTNQWVEKEPEPLPLYFESPNGIG